MQDPITIQIAKLFVESKGNCYVVADKSTVAFPGRVWTVCSRCPFSPGAQWSACRMKDEDRIIHVRRWLRKYGNTQLELDFDE